MNPDIRDTTFVLHPQHEIKPMKQILSWSKRFQQVVNEIPKGYWIWVASGRVFLMKYGPNGDRIMMSGGSVSRDGIVYEITSFTEVDGGDW